MIYYIGIDDHASTCSYAMLDEKGNVVDQGIKITDMVILIGWIKSINGKVHLAIENGVRATWLYHGLREECEEMIVADLRDLGKYRQNKSDRLDALELARLLRVGVLRPVYHHTREDHRSLKEAVRCYEQITQDITRVKNRIKSVYRSLGIMYEGDRVYRKSERKKWLNKIKLIGYRDRAELLFEELDSLVPLKKEAEKRMKKKAVKRKKEYKILRSVEGIGYIRAAQLLGHIGTPTRFRDKRALWKVSGLAVVSRSSGDYKVVNRETGEVKTNRFVNTRGLNKDYNREYKGIFKSAALSAIRADGVFREHYLKRISEGMRPEMARLTIARKISATTLACWRKGEIFDAKKIRPSYNREISKN